GRRRSRARRERTSSPCSRVRAARRPGCRGSTCEPPPQPWTARSRSSWTSGSSDQRGRAVYDIYRGALRGERYQPGGDSLDSLEVAGDVLGQHVLDHSDVDAVAQLLEAGAVGLVTEGE